MVFNIDRHLTTFPTNCILTSTCAPKNGFTVIGAWLVYALISLSPTTPSQFLYCQIKNICCYNSYVLLWLQRKPLKFGMVMVYTRKKTDCA